MNKITRFLKKIYFKYLNKNRNITVYLRGKLSDKQEQIYKNFEQKYILNTKEYSKILLQNIDQYQYNHKINIENNNYNKSIFLEVGFGNGHHINSLVKNNKDKIIIGVELYKEGIVNTIEKIEKDELDFTKNINNLKILNIDARDVINTTTNKTLSRIYILFPDPWHKTRHKKRRILQSDFIKECIQKLKHKGLLIVATDSIDYANEIKENIKTVINTLYKNISNQFSSDIYKYIEYKKSINIHIYNNEERCDYFLNSTEIKYIISSTFAKRAIEENKEINIFLLQIK